MAITTETLIDGLGTGQNRKGFYAKAAGLAQKAINDKNGDEIDTTYAKVNDIPTVDQTYSALSTHAQSGVAVAQAIAGTGQVPTVTSNDDGKVLKATYSGGTGTFSWDSAPSGIPTIQATDEGKVLGVVDQSGTLDWVDLPDNQVQSNWNETDDTSKAFILNKPTIPTVNDSTVTVKLASTTLTTFTTNQASASNIVIPEATTTVTGVMSSADKAKLDGIATGAQVNVKPNWNATAGAADEILNKPTLSTVATSGSYNDLTDKPTIPSIPVTDVQVDGSSVVNVSGVAEITLPTFTQTQADWNQATTTAVDYIKNKPDLSVYALNSSLKTVATSGDYDDLINKPTIPAAQVNADWNASSGVAEILHKPDLSVYAQSSSLSTVATSGDYDDLLNKPTIPDAANDSTVTVDMAGTQSGTNRAVGSFTVDQSSNSTLSIPAAVSGTKTGSTYTTHAQPGVMSYSDKEKLDDIEAGAEANVIKSISLNGGTQLTPSSKNVDIPLAHAGNGGDGLLSYADYTLLHGSMLNLAGDTGNGSAATIGSDIYINGSSDISVDVDDVQESGTDDLYTQITITNNRPIPTVTSSDNGKVLKASYSGGTASYSWQNETGTTYTAGNGIDITSNSISVKVDGTTIDVNSSTGELEVIGGGGGGEMNVVDGVQLEGAASVLPPDVSTKVVTIPNAVATGETGATNGLMTADDKKAICKAVQYVENPYDQSSPKNLIAQQMFVVENDQQIIDIVTNQSQLINGKGTIFFRITGI